MSFLPISTSRNPILKSLLKKLCYITENFTQSGKGKVGFTNLAHFWLRFLFEMYPKIHFPLTFSSPEKPRNKSAISRPLSHLTLMYIVGMALPQLNWLNISTPINMIVKVKASGRCVSGFDLCLNYQWGPMAVKAWIWILQLFLPSSAINLSLIVMNSWVYSGNTVWWPTSTHFLWDHPEFKVVHSSAVFTKFGN